MKGHPSAQTVMQTWRVLTVEQRTGAVERVTWKAIAIGLVLVVGITVAGCFSAFLRYDLIGTGHLPRCALFPVMVLAALNGVSKCLFGKPLLTRAELLGIYCTVLVMTGIPGQQYADYLYLGLIAPIYFANPRNMPALLQYDINWLPYIPDWLVPSKAGVGFTVGNLDGVFCRPVHRSSRHRCDFAATMGGQRETHLSAGANPCGSCR
ncbi:MAG: hypothetical protein SLRJCFUN_002496 [Candidatus Fervidibacter sp.]